MRLPKRRCDYQIDVTIAKINSAIVKTDVAIDQIGSAIAQIDVAIAK